MILRPNKTKKSSPAIENKTKETQDPKGKTEQGPSNQEEKKTCKFEKKYSD